jgi:hypothetical protein
MKVMVVMLIVAAALAVSGCTDVGPLSPDPLRDQQNPVPLPDQQNPCQSSERERPCPDDRTGSSSLLGR